MNIQSVKRYDIEVLSDDRYETKESKDGDFVYYDEVKDLLNKVSEFKTGLKDVTGREIKLGDKIRFYYVDLLGSMTNELDELEFTVEFHQGCVVGVIEDRNPILLRNHMKIKKDRYVPNYGNLDTYVDDIVFCKVIDE